MHLFVFHFVSSSASRHLDRNAVDRKCCVHEPFLVCYWSLDCATSCTNHSVGLFSNCPSSLWLDVLSPRIMDLSHSPSMLNVGANKGYDVRSFIERFSPAWDVTGLQWERSLVRHNATGQPCGACGACGERPRWRSRSNAKIGPIVAVEAERGNFDLLKRLFKSHDLRTRSVRVLHSVVTGPAANSMAFVPVTQEIGTETARPVENSPATLPGQFSVVPTTTIDQLLAYQSIATVDLCLIDTEGHDHAVLRGAEQSLRTHSLRIVAFEYGGLWCFQQPNDACIRLESLIAFLDSFGYSCWWLGNDGNVAHIDPTCADASTRRWSNVGCMADSTLVAKMQELERVGARRASRSVRLETRRRNHA